MDLSNSLKAGVRQFCCEHGFLSHGKVVDFGDEKLLVFKVYSDDECWQTDVTEWFVFRLCDYPRAIDYSYVSYSACCDRLKAWMKNHD